MPSLTPPGIFDHAWLPTLLLVAIDATAQTASPRDQAVTIDRVPLATEEGLEVERLARGLRRQWGLAFVPGGGMLITEKLGGVREWRDGALAPTPLAGGPPGVLAKDDSGLLDIALDPDFGHSRFVYLAFVERDERANRTAIWKARYERNALVDGRVIFRTRHAKTGASHPGGRLLFLPDTTLLLTTGDGFDQAALAQDLGSHWGKTLQLDRQGAAPADNPFIGRAGALPEIWTYGHRNAQGLALNPETGEAWLHEHGPRGGDEINRLRAGANYGWPLVTRGIDYDGKIISERSHAPGHRTFLVLPGAVDRSIGAGHLPRQRLCRLEGQVPCRRPGNPQRRAAAPGPADGAVHRRGANARRAGPPHPRRSREPRGLAGPADRRRPRRAAEGAAQALVWCARNSGTNEGDAFRVRARCKPQRYPGVSRGRARTSAVPADCARQARGWASGPARPARLATTPWPERRGFMCRYFWRTTLARLAAGDLAIGPLHTDTLDDMPQAHADLEHNRVFGKLVGVIAPTDLAITVQR